MNDTLDFISHLNKTHKKYDAVKVKAIEACFRRGENLITVNNPGQLPGSSPRQITGCLALSQSSGSLRAEARLVNVRFIVLYSAENS